MALPGPRIASQAEGHREALTRFLCDLIAARSESAHEEAVVERIRREMEAVGFDEVKVDGLGNVLGRVGSGRRVIAMDAHIDTVGQGDIDGWRQRGREPWKPVVEDGVIYGRGASDQKAGMAGMVYGGKIIKELGLEGDYQLWVTGTVMEEDCDGLCWQYLLKEKVLEPEVVVLTEPTNLQVYRGHRGRMEIRVLAKGVSCHGSAPERGVNAVYKMAPIVLDIERLNERLRRGGDPFLGPGSVTISEITSTSPSLCAVADSATIHLDRRLTTGETLESAVAEIEALESVKRAEARVVVLDYAERAYTGLVYPTKKYYPTWQLPEDHRAVRAGVAAGAAVFGTPPPTGKWVFSTNGVATMGMFGVPTIGFGPANEVYAHSCDDQVPVEHLVKAAAFYAAFPTAYLEET